MPNINLLQDSQAEPEKKPKKTPKVVYYTNPPVESPDKEKIPPLKRSFWGRMFQPTPRRVADRPVVESVLPTTPKTETPVASEPPTRAYRPAEPSPEAPSAPRPKRGFLNIFTRPKNTATAPENTSPKRSAFSASLENPERPSAPLSSSAGARSKPPVSFPKAEKPKAKREILTKELGSTPEATLDSFGVNLLPGDLIDSLEPKPKIATFIIVALVSALLVAGGYGGLLWYEQRIFEQADQTTQDVQQIEVQIKGLRKDQSEALILKSQTDQIKEVLDHHVYWGDFFTELEKFTLPEVSYEQFAGSFVRGQSPTFTLSAQCDNFDTLARQLVVFQDAVKEKEFINQVIINAGELVKGEEGSGDFVRFSVQITVREDVFYRTPDSTTEL